MVRLPSIRPNIEMVITKLSHEEGNYECKRDRVINLLSESLEEGATVIYVSRQKLAERLGDI